MPATKVEVVRADYKAFYPVTTRWGDNDSHGHINNAAYYSYFDSVINAFLIRHAGLDVSNGNVIGLVVSSGCECLAPITFPEPLPVGIRIDRLGNSSVHYGVALFRDGSDIACAFGHLVHVFVERGSHKPVPIEQGVRDKLKKISVGFSDN